MTSIKVTEFKVVVFPGGYSRSWGTFNAKHISWEWTYSMLISKRSGVTFIDGDVTAGSSISASDPFPRPALRQCFERALRLKPGQELKDASTQIKVRKFEKGQALFFDMPCGEKTCVKVSTIRRLVKELSQ